MAIRAQHFEILLLGVHRVAVDVVNLNRDFAGQWMPSCPAAPIALMSPLIQNVVPDGLGKLELRSPRAGIAASLPVPYLLGVLPIILTPRRTIDDRASGITLSRTDRLPTALARFHPLHIVQQSTLTCAW